jgi:hypothetical protein
MDIPEMWSCIFQSNEHEEDICHDMTNKEQILGAVLKVFPDDKSWPSKDLLSFCFRRLQTITDRPRHLGGGVRWQWQCLCEMDKFLTS